MIHYHKKILLLVSIHIFQIFIFLIYFFSKLKVRKRKSFYKTLYLPLQLSRISSVPISWFWVNSISLMEAIIYIAPTTFSKGNGWKFEGHAFDIKIWVEEFLFEKNFKSEEIGIWKRKKRRSTFSTCRRYSLIFFYFSFMHILVQSVFFLKQKEKFSSIKKEKLEISNKLWRKERYR